jgi:vacuolar-type H+-ATPase subunit H
MNERFFQHMSGITAAKSHTLAAILLGLAATCLSPHPAHAGCGLDPVCHISESIGRGAGGGAAEGVRPLVTKVMEEEAPALIAQLQSSIDHNIMTAEQASEKMADYATKLLNKAAEDILDKANTQAKKLTDYAGGQILVVEQQVFSDVQKVIVQFDCEVNHVDTLITRQQAIFNDNANSWLKPILFWQNRKNNIEERCRTEIGISPSLQTAQMQLPTSFKLWRCVRLSYTDANGQATAIRDAFNDTEVQGRATMCALQTGADVALREVTETWISDAQSARAWDRAIRGE